VTELHEQLDDIVREYERAEVTALWLHQRGSEAHTLLFAVIELCPIEQPLSPAIVSGDAAIPMRRQSLVEGQTSLFATRAFLGDPAEGLAFYRGQGGRHGLTPDRQRIELRDLAALEDEPPEELSKLVSGGLSDTYAVLPVRGVGVRVCSRFAAGNGFLESLTEKQRGLLRTFTISTIGIDLIRFSEHLGSVHLTMPNPVLRGWKERLGPDQHSILFEFFERDGCTIRGGTIALTDHRDGGLGFTTNARITGPRQVVRIACDPAEVETRIYHPCGRLLEHQRAAFLRSFSLGVRLGGAKRMITTSDEQKHSVQTYDSAEHSRTGREPAAALTELARVRAERRRGELNAEGEFYLFEGGPASREQARTVIRRLIGEATDRCLLCDPYLSAADVVDFAAFATTSRMKVRLLGAAAFLGKKSPVAGSREGERLAAQIAKTSEADKSLLLECKVLLGREKSPIHDRFLMLDERVFVIGSSLNELGSRLATIYRVPNGPKMAGVLEGWWNNTERTRALDVWLRAPEELDGDGA
jgi:hypothetical protein